MRRVLVCLTTLIVTLPMYSSGQIGGRPGAFSRLGFGARGMGMGNAMAAVRNGDLVGYYNPALLPWNEERHASAGFGILSLDRKLNFLEYSQKLPPNAGLSFGIINAGVDNIEGTDSEGEQTGALRTSENQAFLGFAVRFPAGFSLGLNVKFYYYHLYTDINSTTVGLDFGFAYVLAKDLTLAATIRDVNSKYKWDTSKLYGLNGETSEEKFPLLYTAAAAYNLPDSLGFVSVEIEKSNASTLTARCGLEIPLLSELTVRGGMDRIDLKEKGNGVKPTFGFTVRKDFDSWTPALTYAYVVEPFSTSGMHMISLGVMF